MMYDVNEKWCFKQSEHFIFKYPPNTLIEKDIEDIIQKREKAFNKISKFLNIEINRLLTLYFSPNKHYCLSRQMIIQAAVPHKYFASVIYNDYPFCTERIKFGHEIAHLLLYFWDKEMYHLEFLEEGLATILDMSNTNYHLDYFNKLENQYGQQNIDLSLKIEPYYRSTDYKKAASFVKFLIDKYGLAKFKKLYLSTRMTRKERIFFVNGKILSIYFLQNALKDIYKKDYKTLQKEWLKVLGFTL